MRNTKIVCTIGPASSSESMLRKLIGSGMDVARLNFSHGSLFEHQRTFRRLRALAQEARRPLAIMQDIQGPRIRLGKLPGGKLELKKGSAVVFRCGAETAPADRIPINHPHLWCDLKRGERLLLADGTIQIKITEVRNRDIAGRVIAGGTISDHQGMNFPDSNLSISGITARDRQHLMAGARLGFDLVAVSFVRSPADVLEVRRILEKAGSHPQVLAKIEHPQALRHLDDILEVSDGIMLARGDLGVELPPEKLPSIQKSAIARANQKGKLVIVATQMLESMRFSSRPTRAEASDVANAVFDGADALMLSGETSIGAYPLESLQMMVRIINEAEKSQALHRHLPVLPIERPSPIPHAVALAACVAAGDVGAKLIVAFTATGSTARLISDQRPRARIIALTTSTRTYHLLAAYWGVEPIKVAPVRSTDAMLQLTNRTLLDSNLAQPGDAVVIVSGVPVGIKGSTNMLKIHRLH